MGISYGKEEETNGAYGIKSLRRHWLDIDDIVRGGRYLDTSGRSSSAYGFPSSSGSKRNHHH